MNKRTSVLLKRTKYGENNSERVFTHIPLKLPSIYTTFIQIAIEYCTKHLTKNKFESVLLKNVTYIFTKRMIRLSHEACLQISHLFSTFKS